MTFGLTLKKCGRKNSLNMNFADHWSFCSIANLHEIFLLRNFINIPFLWALRMLNNLKIVWKIDFKFTIILY